MQDFWCFGRSISCPFGLLLSFGYEGWDLEQGLENKGLGQIASFFTALNHQNEWRKAILQSVAPIADAVLSSSVF